MTILCILSAISFSITERILWQYCNHYSYFKSLKSTKTALKILKAAQKLKKI